MIDCTVGDWRHGLTDERFFAYGPLSNRFLDLRCAPLALFSEGCLEHAITEYGIPVFWPRIVGFALALL
jgi:hypothetical protein